MLQILQNSVINTDGVWQAQENNQDNVDSLQEKKKKNLIANIAVFLL